MLDSITSESLNEKKVYEPDGRLFALLDEEQQTARDSTLSDISPEEDLPDWQLDTSKANWFQYQIEAAPMHEVQYFKFMLWAFLGGFIDTSPYEFDRDEIDGGWW